MAIPIYKVLPYFVIILLIFCTLYVSLCPLSQCNDTFAPLYQAFSLTEGLGTRLCLVALVFADLPSMTFRTADASTKQNDCENHTFFRVKYYIHSLNKVKLYTI